ncbi:MAG TPA: hypothetical protein VF516_03105 [Kofleriaceae bacterium]
MRLLVACEYSGAVRRAFRARGHDAWSCDLLQAEDGSEHHIQGNVVSRRIIDQGWDGLIAFPDCTYLAVSGARWMSIPWRAAAQEWALAFVRTLWALPIKKKALENPIGRLSTLWRKPDQIIQPWQFGHGETKATCLWLDGFPPLTPTQIVEGRHGRVWLEPPSDDRWKERSRTYEGVAQAMAEQWGGTILEKAA